MVLVLAALYSLYRRRQEQQQDDQPQQDLNDDDDDSSNTALQNQPQPQKEQQQQSQSMYQKLQQQWHLQHQQHDPTTTADDSHNNDDDENNCHNHQQHAPQHAHLLQYYPPPPPDDQSSFREDVRQEWMDAVFGPEHALDDDTTTTSNHDNPATSTRRTFSGVGKAGIASWVAYRATIPGTSTTTTSTQESSTTTTYAASDPAFHKLDNSILDTSTDQENHTNEIMMDATTPATATTKRSRDTKLGLTLGRLPLGVYVYSVDPTCEAFFLGIPVGAVLVSINHMPFLAEPSRTALERLWQYEGVYSSVMHHSAAAAITNHATTTTSTSNNNNNTRTNNTNSKNKTNCADCCSESCTCQRGQGTAGATAATTALPVDRMHSVALLDSASSTISSTCGDDAAEEKKSDSGSSVVSPSHQQQQSPSPSPQQQTISSTVRSNATATTSSNHSSSVNTPPSMNDPVAFTYIFKGRLRTVLFLGGQFPFGITWAPCVHLPVVKRVYACCANPTIGVRKGSILARVNGRSFRHCDHADFCQQLRELLTTNQSIHLTLCFPPAAARTSQYAKLVTNTHPHTIQQPYTSANPTVQLNHRQQKEQQQQQSSQKSSSLSGSSSHSNNKRCRSSQRKCTTIIHDGVQIKFHPLEYAIGSFCSAAVSGPFLPFGNRQQHNSNNHNNSNNYSNNNEKAGCGGNKNGVYHSYDSPNPYHQQQQQYYYYSYGGGGGANSNNNTNNRCSCYDRQHAAALTSIGITEEWAYKVATGHEPELSYWKQQFSERLLLQSSSTTGCSRNGHDCIMDQLAPKKVYSPCPLVKPQDLLDFWDPLASLVECLSFCSFGYRMDDTTFISNSKRNRKMYLVGPSAHDNDYDVLGVLKQLTSSSRHDSSLLVGSYLLQILGLICAPSSCLEKGRTHTGVPQNNLGRIQSTDPKHATELTSMLLKLSRKDQGFCQRLYFLLRSFIATLEMPSSSSSQNASTTTTCSNQRNLVGLLNCLEMLRLAEKELAGAANALPQEMVEMDHRTAATQAICEDGIIELPAQHEAVENVESRDEFDGMEEIGEGYPEFDVAAAAAAAADHESVVSRGSQSTPPTPVAASPTNDTLGDNNKVIELSDSLRQRQQQQHKVEKKKGFFGRFRKKKATSIVGGSSYSIMVSPQSQGAMTPSPVHSLRMFESSWNESVTSNSNANHNAPQPKHRIVSNPIHQNNTPVQTSSMLPLRDRYATATRTHSQAGTSAAAPPKAETAKAVVSRVPRICESPFIMYDNMSDFLGELDRICGTIERSLQKSFRQKMADWAMQPWSPSKDSALAEVTTIMREHLAEITATADRMLLVNPVDSSELFSSVDHDECYILPSAHFPILLTFDVSERRCSDQFEGEERLYRTKVELIALRAGDWADRSFVVHAAVAGSILESSASENIGAAMPGTAGTANLHVWQEQGVLIFDTRSSWGAPQTISLRLSSKLSGSSSNANNSEDYEEFGYAWIDLSRQFESSMGETTTVCVSEIRSVQDGMNNFDEHGDLPVDPRPEGERVELKVKITTESVGFSDTAGVCRKRMLLYKHNDDLRQEAFAMQFIKTCDNLLKASGLDLKLLTFDCIPVGIKRGFVEWVPGSVPLSEICQPFAGSILGNDKRTKTAEVTPLMFNKAGLTKYASLRRLGGQQNDSLRRLGEGLGTRGSFANNPIQDYLRSVAYDANAPYLIRRDVMDTYVKSCAGYSVITYILGVGDRHLDNLLLHQSGSFFHCDYSFILGSDPKTYLPVRVTEDMVYGMGGTDSDNYARFLSMVGAAFLSLRRPENVRIILSMVRLMEFACIPDISEKQTILQAITGIRDRLRLDLSESEAVAYVENLVESSQSSRMWIAVDAIHSLGKKF